MIILLITNTVQNKKIKIFIGVLVINLSICGFHLYHDI